MTAGYASVTVGDVPDTPRADPRRPELDPTDRARGLMVVRGIEAAEDARAQALVARDAWVREMAAKYPQRWTPSTLAELLGMDRSSVHNIITRGTNTRAGRGES
jgi:hypothetical protein